jgi:hypothetical protein
VLDFHISTPLNKNIVTHFCKFFKRGFQKIAVILNEAQIHSNFDNLVYQRLVIAAVNLQNHKYSSSIRYFVVSDSILKNITK